MCEVCGGTGVKRDDSEGEQHQYKGIVRVNLVGQCPFSEETVKEFVEFLENCGGFQIW